MWLILVLRFVMVFDTEFVFDFSEISTLREIFGIASDGMYGFLKFDMILFWSWYNTVADRLSSCPLLPPHRAWGCHGQVQQTAQEEGEWEGSDGDWCVLVKPLTVQQCTGSVCGLGWDLFKGQGPQRSSQNNFRPMPPPVPTLNYPPPHRKNRTR